LSDFSDGVGEGYSGAFLFLERKLATQQVQHEDTSHKTNFLCYKNPDLCYSSLKFKKMKANSKNIISELSYYRLLLLDFLRESHPERTNDSRFIATRAEVAAETYSKAIMNGSNDTQAENEALLILFEGLYFSKYDTIVNILWNEFSNEIPEEDAREAALNLLSQLEFVFSSYTLSDDFIYELEYDLLYTELTGAIELIIKNGELRMIVNS